MKDALFINGQIYTFESSPAFVEALAVRDGRIAAIGRSADLRDSCSGFRRVDLGGRTVVPGFVDSHIHVPSFGLSLHLVDLTGTRSLVEAVGLVAAAVRRGPPGGGGRGRGGDKNAGPGERFSAKKEPHPITPEQPRALSSPGGALVC